jgi:archaellum component FlaG (FlaF/FlaG flagellin family)
MAAKNSDPRQLHDAVGGYYQFTNADTTSPVDILTAPSGQENEIYIHSVVINSTDAGANNLTYYIRNTSGVYINIGSRTVAANSNQELIANTTTLLSRFMTDLAGNYYIRLKPGERFAVAIGTVLTGGETIRVDVDASSFKKSV